MEKQIIIKYDLDSEDRESLTINALLGKDNEDNDITKVVVTRNVSQEIKDLLNQIIEKI